MGAFYYPPPRTGRGAVSYTTGFPKGWRGQIWLIFLTHPTAKSDLDWRCFITRKFFTIIYVESFFGYVTLREQKGIKFQKQQKENGMATYKHLTDLLKICSVLPALAIMPAMAEEPIVNNNNLAQSDQVYSGTIAGQAADNTTRGGAVTIDVDVSGVSVADGTSFIGNKHLADTGGGAIKALNGFTIGNNVTFDGNTADNDGWAGALYIKLADKANQSENTTVKIGENSVFKNNSGLFGGAIGLEYGTLEIANGAQFIGNHANGTEDTFGGGAIIVWQDAGDRPELHSTLKLNNATFEENTAKKYGAAIAVFDTGATTTINGGSFKKNSVAESDAKNPSGGADL